MTKKRLSALVVLYTTLFFVTVLEASASTVDCEVVDTYINEIVENVSVTEGDTVKIPRQKMEKYLPSGLDFLVSHERGRAYIYETQKDVKKTQKVTNEYVRNVYPKLKYSIECTHPYTTLPPIVETQSPRAGQPPAS